MKYTFIMRNKFIELLHNQNCPSPYLCDATCKYAHLQNCYAERVADHLIANNAIILPCKIGDTVYVILNGSIYQTEIIRIKYEEEAENYGKFIRERVYAIIDNVEIEFNFGDFGKIIFFTKEEAEQVF